MVNVCRALRVGCPLSLTRKMTVQVPIWVLAGVHANAPVAGSSDMPGCAPLLMVYVSVLAGRSTSLATSAMRSWLPHTSDLLPGLASVGGTFTSLTAITTV